MYIHVHITTLHLSDDGQGQGLELQQQSTDSGKCKNATALHLQLTYNTCMFASCVVAIGSEGRPSVSSPPLSPLSWSALMASCRSDTPEIVAELLKAGANPNAPNHVSSVHCCDCINCGWVL